MSQGYSTDASKLGGTQSVSLVFTDTKPFSEAVLTAQDAGAGTSAVPDGTPSISPKLPTGREISLQSARDGSPITDFQGKPVVPSSVYASATELKPLRMNPGFVPGDNPVQAFRFDTSLPTVPGDKTQPSIMVRSNGVGSEEKPVEAQARGNFTTADPAITGRYIAGANPSSNTVMAGASVDINPKGSAKGEPNASAAVQVSQNVTPGAVNATTVSGSVMAGVGPVGVYASGRTNDLRDSGRSSTQGEVGVRVPLDNGPPRTAMLAPRGVMVFAQANDSTTVNPKTGVETDRSDPRVGVRVTDLSIAKVGDGKLGVDLEVTAGQNDLTASASMQYRANNGNFSAGIEGRYRNFDSARPDEFQAVATVSLSFGGAPPSAPKPPTLPVPSQPVATQPQVPDRAVTIAPQASAAPLPPIPSDGFTRVSDLDTAPATVATPAPLATPATVATPAPVATPSQTTSATAPQPQTPSPSAQTPSGTTDTRSSAVQDGVDVMPLGDPSLGYSPFERYTRVADLATQPVTTASTSSPAQNEVAAYQPAPPPVLPMLAESPPDKVSVRPYEAPGAALLPPDARDPLAGIVPAR